MIYVIYRQMKFTSLSLSRVGAMVRARVRVEKGLKDEG